MRFSSVARSARVSSENPFAALAIGFAPFVCLSLLFAGTVSRGQEQVASQPAIRSTAELVKVDVSVLDKRGDYVGGLEQKDFRVLDNNAERPLAFFAPVDAAAQVLVIVETSPAVYLIHNQHLAAAYALLDGLRPDDEVALIAYDRAPRPILAFTADKPALVQALNRIQYTLGSGDLSLYDSISTSLDWLAPVIGKKAIVLLTTGLDSAPPERWDALVAKLRADDAVIYPVALGGALRRPVGKKPKQPKHTKDSDPGAAESTDATENPLSFQKADTALNALAKMTGGQVYFPQSAGDFARIYSEIASALRHQYLLGIEPAHDGQFHRLAVEVLNQPGTPSSKPSKSAFRVFAREGYLAPVR